MILTLLYDLFLLPIALAVWTKTLAMRRRFGSLETRLWGDFPKIDSKGRYTVWIHAISVGEAVVIAPLVRLIKNNIPDALIIVSSITTTGHQTAVKFIPFADYHVYLPFDFSWNIRRQLNSLRPNLVLICETDFWYNFLTYCKRHAATILLVNGRLSALSCERYKKIPFFSHRLFKTIDHFLVQNEVYYERFCHLGIPSSSISVTGNLKFEGDYSSMNPKELGDFKEKLGVQSGDIVFVCGSTHPGEEKLILSALKEIVNAQEGEGKIFFVPRHPERWTEIKALLEELNISFSVYSQIQAPPIDSKVIIFDQMGVLCDCYQIATFAIVGGSFIPGEGGHNILEPCWYGVPVLFGPYMDAQTEMVELVLQSGAGRQVAIDSLSDTLEHLLSDSKERNEMVSSTHKVLKNKGITKQTWQMICSIAGLEL